MYDYHTHNGYTACVDKVWSVEEGWRISKSFGVQKLGIANHVHFKDPIQDFLPRVKDEIDNFGEKNIVFGVELDIESPEGINVLSRENMELLDYIIAGPHHQPIAILESKDVSEAQEKEYFHNLRKTLLTSFKNIPVDIWPHPFLHEVEKFKDKYWCSYLLDIYTEVLELCANRGIALEISSYWHRFSPKPNGIVKNWSPGPGIDGCERLRSPHHGFGSEDF